MIVNPEANKFCPHMDEDSPQGHHPWFLRLLANLLIVKKKIFDVIFRQCTGVLNTTVDDVVYLIFLCIRFVRYAKAMRQAEGFDKI